MLLGIKIENVTHAMLGRAKKVVTGSRLNTTIVSGAGKKAEIERACRHNQRAAAIEENDLGNRAPDWTLQGASAKLAGGVAVTASAARPEARSYS